VHNHNFRPEAKFRPQRRLDGDAERKIAAKHCKSRNICGECHDNRHHGDGESNHLLAYNRVQSQRSLLFYHLPAVRWKCDA
jgi:hypothetical protein